MKASPLFSLTRAEADSFLNRGRVSCFLGREATLNPSKFMPRKHLPGVSEIILFKKVASFAGESSLRMKSTESGYDD